MHGLKDVRVKLILKGTGEETDKLKECGFSESSNSVYAMMSLTA